MNPHFKEGFVNIRNSDQKCFLWSILAHLHPFNDGTNRHAERVNHYVDHEYELNMRGINYPAQIKDIPKF